MLDEVAIAGLGLLEAHTRFLELVHIDIHADEAGQQAGVVVARHADLDEPPVGAVCPAQAEHVLVRHRIGAGRRVGGEDPRAVVRMNLLIPAMTDVRRQTAARECLGGPVLEEQAVADVVQPHLHRNGLRNLPVARLGLDEPLPALLQLAHVHIHPEKPGQGPVRRPSGNGDLQQMAIEAVVAPHAEFERESALLERGRAVVFLHPPALIGMHCVQPAVSLLLLPAPAGKLEGRGVFPDQVALGILEPHRNRGVLSQFEKTEVAARSREHLALPLQDRAEVRSAHPGAAQCDRERRPVDGLQAETLARTPAQRLQLHRFSQTGEDEDYGTTAVHQGLDPLEHSRLRDRSEQQRHLGVAGGRQRRGVRRVPQQLYRHAGGAECVKRSPQRSGDRLGANNQNRALWVG